MFYAAIIVDNELEYEVIGSTTIELPPGPHNISVAASGYMPQTKYVNVYSGHTYSLTYYLTKYSGTININYLGVEDEKVYVLVDGEFVAELTSSPISIEVDPGTHIVELMANGYISVWKEVNVSPGATISEVFTLTRYLVDFTPMPSITERHYLIIVDDKIYDSGWYNKMFSQSPPFSEYIPITIDPGYHEINLYFHPSASIFHNKFVRYKASEYSTTFDLGDVLSYSFDIIPEQGLLKIMISGLYPQDKIGVYVDNVYAGTFTKDYLQNYGLVMDPGNHAIKLIYTEMYPVYKTSIFEDNVIIISGQQSALSATLTSSYPATGNANLRINFDEQRDGVVYIDGVIYYVIYASSSVTLENIPPGTHTITIDMCDAMSWTLAYALQWSSSISWAKQHYYPYSTQVTLNPDSTTDLSIHNTDLNRMGGNVELTLTLDGSALPERSEAIVILDNMIVFSDRIWDAGGKVNLYEVPIGTHTINVTALLPNGILTYWYSGQINVEPSDDNSFTISLSPYNGDLSITLIDNVSNNPFVGSVMVYIDNKTINKYIVNDGTLLLEKLIPGQRVITLMAKNNDHYYSPLTFSETVTSGETKYLTIYLPRSRGEIEITLLREGEYAHGNVILFLNNSTYYFRNIDGYIRIGNTAFSELRPGTYNIYAEFIDDEHHYRPYTVSTILQPGETYSMNINLARDYGDLSLYVYDQYGDALTGEAIIFIDGEVKWIGSMSETISISEVKEGQHVISIELNDYSRVTTLCNVIGDEVTILSIALNPDHIINIYYKSTDQLYYDLGTQYLTLYLAAFDEFEVNITNGVVFTAYIYGTNRSCDLAYDNIDKLWKCRLEISDLDSGLHTIIINGYGRGYTSIEDEITFYIKEESSLNIVLSSNTIRLDETVNITGIIYPVIYNASVTISYSTDGETWTDLSTVYTNENGVYYYVWSPPTLGTYYIKASWPGNETISSAESNIVTLNILKLLSTITCSASSTEISIGENVNITGSISPLKPNVRVKISWRKGYGEWEFVYVDTDANGKYTFTWSPYTPGTYEVKASWEGDELYEGAESIILTIHVSSISETSSPTTSPTTSPISETTETSPITPSPLYSIIIYAAVAGAIATIVIVVLLMMKRARG